MTDTTPSYKLYGQDGWGSAIVEALLTAANLPFEFIDVAGFIGEDGVNHPTAGRDLLADVNPLLQVPTLVLPNGEVMTESAAIALYVADVVPDAGLAPKPSDPARAAFLRWLIWIVTNVYPTFTYGDFPSRWCDASDSLRTSTDRYRERLWRQCDAACRGPWFLGERMSAIDLYLAVMIHWRPRRAWFESEAPALTIAADHAAAHPGIAAILARNFGAG